jgi:hypothetical protein
LTQDGIEKRHTLSFVDWEVDDFVLLESSAPEGTLQEAVTAIMSLPEAAGKWCVLILCPKLGNFDEHTRSPLFWFPSFAWKEVAPLIMSHIEAIERVHWMLPKLKIFFLWGFFSEATIEGLQDGRAMVGDIAQMLTEKIAYQARAAAEA